MKKNSVLTFDIEDWYNCDFISENLNWDNHEVRIYDGVERILELLKEYNTKATFFCLGWIAEKHPAVIRMINNNGHHIGCHSYQHQLAYKFSRAEFYKDTERAKKLLEDVTGNVVDAYRAPAFSIIESNLNYLECLVDLNFKYDASILPAKHEYGGIPSFNCKSPFIFETVNGTIKEFPMSTFGKRSKIIYSGGGYFRILPYPFIKLLSNQNDYLMTYFHPRDFDVNQPRIYDLPLHRKIKSYIGLKGAFLKLEKYLGTFDFNSIRDADNQVNWINQQVIKV
jgi:polysaccharide deacetylase family protein (PEP-CTERM system associated)